MTDRNPLVSVVVPNYNYARTLPLCLRAVQAQTYAPIEILVVDDHSTDDSVRVAEALGAQVIRTPVNSGQAVTRNLGAQRARGEVLFFLDSDVALAPDAVANAMALLGSDASIGAVCGCYSATPLLRDSLIEDYRTLHQYYWFAESEGEIQAMNTAMCAIRASVFAEVGPFNPELRDVEDHDYGLRIAARHTVWSTAAVSGDHDHDHSLRVILRKVFRRTRRGIPLFIRRRGLPGGFATGPRALGSMLALASLPALALPALLGPVALAAPALLLAGSIGCDVGMYRWVLRRRGLPFAAFFIGVQYVVNLAVAAGAAVGVAQWLLSERFRRSYGTGAAPSPAAG